MARAVQDLWRGERKAQRLADTFAGDRLKKFHPSVGWRLHLDHAPDLDRKNLPNLDNFLTGDGDSNLSDVPDNISDL